MRRSALLKRLIERFLIQPKVGPLTRLRLNEPQRRLWAQLEDDLDQDRPIRWIILKGRQFGISTLIAGLLTARFLLDELVHLKIVAHHGGGTKHLWDMARLMVEHSPVQPLVKVRGSTMHLGLSTYACRTAGSPHATRSFTLRCGHLSEVAFWPHPEAWVAMLQTVPQTPGSWVFVESTANGKTGQGQLFYEEWTRAERGKTQQLRPVFLPWIYMAEYEVPHCVYPEEVAGGTPPPGVRVVTDLTPVEQELRRLVPKVYGVPLRAGQIAWRRLMLADACRDNENLFNQEYPIIPEVAFVASGTPLFAQRHLLALREHIQPGRRYRLELGGRFVADPDGYVTVWKAPEPDRRYIIGADSALGIADPAHSASAAQVLDLETLEQVAEYECASAPFVFAQHLAWLGRRYNMALLAPEIQASGGGGGRELLVHLQKDHNYWNIYRYKHVDRTRPDPGRLYGWETNARTRPRMIDRAIEAVHTRAAIIHSEALLRQMENFGLNDAQRCEALSGRDDLLFAWMIALVVRSEEVGARAAVEPPGLGPLRAADWRRLGLDVWEEADPWAGSPEPVPTWLEA